MSRNLNKITLKLLDEGYTKDQTPPGMRRWNEFEGGWTYDFRSGRGIVFETPCGLLLQRAELGSSGYMSYMGVDWTEENDCPTIVCPYYDRQEPCQLNHPLLREHDTAGGHYEHLYFCAAHETDRAFDYEQSVSRVRDLAKAEMEQLWQVFSEKHHGRVCRHHSRYNRKTKQWSMHYDPMICRMYQCTMCAVLGKPLSAKRANVFYDLKKTWTEKGQGLFPDEERASVKKGIKLLEKPISETLCEAIVKSCRREIIDREMMRHHADLFFKRYALEVLNIRAERRESRDLLQDLRDIQDGIEVVHESDQKKAAAAKKSEKRKKNQEERIRRMEKKILSVGWVGLSTKERRQAEKLIDDDRLAELDDMRAERLSEVQISLF